MLSIVPLFSATVAFGAAQNQDMTTDEWYEGLLDWLARAGQILAALVTAGAVLGFTWAVYRRTLGRRRTWYGRLARLGTNAQIDFFSAVLSEPPAMRRTVESDTTRYDDAGKPRTVTRSWTECVWIDRDFYVHVLADEDESVHAYSVTTRRKRFRPRFRQPGAWRIRRGRLGRLLRLPQAARHPRIKVGKTRFRKLGKPAHAESWIGAHNLHYFEHNYGGNPGFYQSFVYSINDAGYGAWDASVWDFDNMDDFSWGTASNEPQDDDSLPAFHESFRHRARINTYTVLGPELSLEDYPFYHPPAGWTIFGPNSSRTRTLAAQQT